MRLVLLGAPGSGKGTQGEKLSKKLQIPQLSTGDILRSAIRAGTEMGKLADTFMSRGELVPNDVILGLMDERLKKDDCKNGYILDGFPRTIPQAEGLDRILTRSGAKLDAALNIDVKEDEVIKRLGGRRQCSKCSAVYHLEFSPSKKGTICDKCGGELYQRDDDKDATIKNRLKVYNKETAPLIDYYKKILKSVDGNGSADDVFRRTCSLIGI